MSARLLRLGAIATAAGAFSGLFGVGGGTIIVPLLVLWFGYGQKEATGTSLAAIFVIGVLGAAGHALYGNVDLWKGVLISIPAVAGVVAGAALQQRISERAAAGGFAVVLLASAAGGGHLAPARVRQRAPARRPPFAWQLAKKAGLR